MSAREIFDLLTAGDRAALARAITLVESRKAEHRAQAIELLELCRPLGGKALRLGITGVPGVGKSTFIERFGLQLIEQGHRIAVLAIDPTSDRSKGSILGDKTRMEELSASKQAFIRPTATGGQLGGVAHRTHESMLLFEAAGYDVILVETVGVGQSETAVHDMVDGLLLLLLPGAGDELQGIKRGIVEMADILVVNKADSGREKHARESAADYSRALHLFPPSESGWQPKVLRCSALEGIGLEEVWGTVKEYRAAVEADGFLERKRTEQQVHWLHQDLLASLAADFYNNDHMKGLIEAAEGQIRAGEKHSATAAAELIGKYRSK